MGSEMCIRDSVHCHLDRGHQQWTCRFLLPAVGGCVRWRFVDGCQRAFLEMAAIRFVSLHVFPICLGACLENVQERKLDDSCRRYWATRMPTGRSSRQRLWQASRSSDLVAHPVDGGRNSDRFLVDPKRPAACDRLLSICHANVHLWFHVPQHRHADLSSQERTPPFVTTQVSQPKDR